MADYRFPGEHMYKTLVLEGAQTNESVDKTRDVQFVDGDILISTYPKTGTTWVEELIYLIVNGGNIEEALKTRLTERMLFLEHTQSYHNGQAGVDILKRAQRPAIMKTHLPAWVFEKQLVEGHGKFVIVIRNPKDTLVSMYHFYRMNSGLGNFQGTWDEFFELFKSKHLMFGDYFDWYESWIPYLDKPNVELIKYEDMKKDIRGVIGRLCTFLNKPLPLDKIDPIIQHTSFKSMKSNKMVNNESDDVLKKEISPFIRKGEVADWKNYFSPEQNRLVDEEYRTRLERKGVILQFE